jgi:hypothetical protein
MHDLIQFINIAAAVALYSQQTKIVFRGQRKALGGAEQT